MDHASWRRSVPGELGRFLHAAVLDPADETPDPPSLRRRRRIVVALTMVAGALLLAWALRLPAGQPAFHVATSAQALLWLTGARLSGPVPLGRGRRRSGDEPSHAIVQSLVLGGALLLLFLAGALLVAGVSPLRTPVDALLAHSHGALPLVAATTAANGLAEEYFFRGALFRALPARGQITASTGLYALVTAGTGVPLLVLAAVVLGVVVALQRRATGGFLAPVITHLTWSLGMLVTLPVALHLGERWWG